MGAKLRESFECFDASQARVWKPHLGQGVVRAEILGWKKTPSVVALRFNSGGVVLGCGYEYRFGDGDDVVIWDAAEFDADPKDRTGATAVQLWDSSR